MYNILICDDDEDIRRALKIYLSAEGYSIYEAENGSEAIECIRNNNISLAMLDVMMPVMDGITATAAIRSESNIPIIIISAKSEDTDKIIGLNIGADDYITKPFNPVELTARVRSAIRRYTMLGNGKVHSKDLISSGLKLSDSEKKVWVDEVEVSLTPTEFDILKFLMSNPNTVFSPTEIYEKVWGEKAFNTDNTLAVHIRHLREKIEIDPAEPRYVKVVWGRGYKFHAEKKQ